jgi:hypothetical protein
MIAFIAFAIVVFTSAMQAVSYYKKARRTFRF